MCDTCGASVPCMSLERHAAFCRKNNQRCPAPGCGVVLRIKDAHLHVHCPQCDLVSNPEGVAKHTAQWHGRFPCPCGVEMELGMLLAHRRTDCPSRLIVCR